MSRHRPTAVHYHAAPLPARGLVIPACMRRRWRGADECTDDTAAVTCRRCLDSDAWRRAAAIAAAGAIDIAAARAERAERQRAERQRAARERAWRGDDPGAA